ncbi:MAG: DNA-3-methyladenine glycosylase I [Acidimicrobiales bacterium]|nr:DNA-3-methyladenine glycosylase I [Hyphomonadaceae bacterium]RZV43762.1 MAG: DNA-3-methyladenine glycosylase I [Acidimicrobiales bacterium]
MAHNPDIPRCQWVPPKDELYCHYHDTEWGVPNYDSKSLFNKLILDGMQAGLSWITILRKRPEILKAFDGLDPDIVAYYTDKDRERLLGNPGIIRSKLKINAAISNAQIFIKMRDEEDLDFSEYCWGFVGGKPVQNTWIDNSQVPARSEEGDALAKDLKKRGFKFTGPVIVYAFMQAVGMINDHLVDCHVYDSVKRAAK